MEVGLRVVRGQEWKWSNEDGGEGCVGTVIEFHSGRSVGEKSSYLVLWDVGKMKVWYLAEPDGSCNSLRVLDNRPAGRSCSNLSRLIYFF